jgi:hypothetical protein
VRGIAYAKDGQQLLTATSDALKVWGCEPAVHHDTVQMDWRHLADMHLTYKDDQPRVIGCCCSNSAVGVFLVDLRKVAPFNGGSMAAAAGSDLMAGCGSNVRSTSAQQQQRNGIGRHSLQPQQRQQPATFIESPVVPGSSPNPSYNAGQQAAMPAGPLMQQLSRQRTPPGLPTRAYTADKSSSIAAAKQRQGGEVTQASPLQPGQLPPAIDGGMLQQQQQQQRRRTGDTFPELEIRVPAGPPPARPAVEDYGGPHRSSSRDYGSSANSSSNNSSRRASGYDAEAAAAGMRGMSFAEAAPFSYNGVSEQQHQYQQQQPYSAVPSRMGSREAASAGGMGALSGNSRDWHQQASAAGLATAKSSSAPGDMPAAGSIAPPAPDPILAAMAQRPLLKSDLARMVSALQLAKGFVARGNFEGAYKAVLNQGDAAVACMLVESLQSRQDAFELNSVEPLIKLLELLLASGQEQQQGVGLSALALVLRGPGQVVREVCGGPSPVGVDLSYEQRKNKCLLVKMGLEGLGMKLGVLARGNGPLAARAQLHVEELKRVVG